MAAAFLTAGCAPAPEPPQIKDDDISLRIGLANNTSSSTWSAVRLRVKNTGANFDGVLDVVGVGGYSGAEQPDPVVYRMKLEIPGKSQTAREFSFPVLPDRFGQVRAVLRQPGYAKELLLSLKHPEEVVEGPTRRALVIGEASPNLAALKASIARAWKLDSAENVLFSRSASKDLATHAAAYDEFDLVIVYMSSLTDAPDGTANALIRWVERGGTLLAFPGPQWAGGLSEAAKRLFGVQLGTGNERRDEIKWKLGRQAEEGFLADLQPIAPGRTLSSGLLVEARRGCGSVFTASFTPTGEKFPDPSASGQLHSSLSRAFVAATKSSPPRISARLESAAETCLRRLASFQTPPRSSVVWGLAIYLGVGFFLPWILFRALRRPEWTYAAVIVASAAFTFGIYRYGLLSALQLPELEELTILRVHPDGRAAEATSFVGLMSPSASRMSLLGDGSVDSENPLTTALPRPFLESRRQDRGWTTGFLEDRHVIEVDRAGRLRLEALALHPNELRSVRYDYKLEDSRVWELMGTISTSILPEAREAIQAVERGDRAYEMVGSRDSVFPGARQITRRHAITLVLRETRENGEPEADEK